MSVSNLELNFLPLEETPGRNELQKIINKKRGQTIQSLHDNFGELKGMKIVSKDPVERTVRIGQQLIPIPENCDGYVFRGQPWYEEEYLPNSLLNKDIRLFYTSGLQTLNKHYALTNDPKVGSIVVYLRKDGKIGHFAKVQKIQSAANKRIIECISRFGSGYVFEHPIHMIPTQYGTHYAFFKKIQDIAEKNEVHMALSKPLLKVIAAVGILLALVFSQSIANQSA